MQIKMLDGRDLDISNFDIECDAKDDAGRHFSGNAAVHVDLRYNTEVCLEFRKLWTSNAHYDGDWGADFEHCIWEEYVEPAEYHMFKVCIGDEYNDGHGMYNTEFVKATASKGDIQQALTKAISEFPELCNICTKYEDVIVDATLLDRLYAKGLVLGDEIAAVRDVTKTLYLQESSAFVGFFLNIANLYMDTPFTYEIIVDSTPELSLPSSGYGIFS